MPASSPLAQAPRQETIDRGRSCTPKARPRVLLLTPDFPPTQGGIQILLARLAQHAHELDFSVLTLTQPGAEVYDRTQRAAVTRVGRGHHRARRLRRVSIATLGITGVARSLRHTPDLVLSGHILTAHAAAAIRRLCGVPFIQYLYAMEATARPATASFALTRADAVVVLGDYGRSLALRTGARSERVHAIPPGVDLPAEQVRRQPASPPTIVTVARLRERYKGHDVLLRALALVRARLPDIQWVVIGDGPLRPLLEERAAALGLQGNVRLLGVVDDDERDAWLARAHLLAMPSRLPGSGRAGEGFGIVYLEAAARGLPVLAGNVGGALDAVRDGVTGRLVDPTDPHAVAVALLEILCDPELAARLGEQGRAWAQQFAWPLIAARFQRLALQVLEAAR
jgi:phosphatidylinositol alpha-1,6-mannosyltransferase